MNKSPANAAQTEAAIKVFSNFYLVTTGQKTAPWMGTKDAPTFTLPDSRFRYANLCSTALIAACGERMSVAIANECQKFLVSYCRENAQVFFGGPITELDAAKFSETLSQHFLDAWAQYNENEKKLAALPNDPDDLTNTTRSKLIGDQLRTISVLVHETESKEALTEADAARLSKLSLNIACVIPTMRDAFLDLVTLSPEELKKTQAAEMEMGAKVDAAYAAAKTDPSKIPEFQAAISAALGAEHPTRKTYVPGTIGRFIGVCLIVLIWAVCIILVVGAFGALLNYFGTPEFLLSGTTAILLGAFLFIFSARYIGGVRLTLKDSLWMSAIAHVFTIIVSGVLGYLLSSHLAIGLVLATCISLIFEAALFKIQAIARHQKLKTGKAYSIAILMILSDIFISSPLVAFIISRKI